ncbi:MAG TPA: hypothetical protein VH107_04355 [Lacipirellulaceae bacterium]|jgi:hypothetical protein|nr:hypothetical protein [Lacipirellulaceae bacterium]
MTVVTVTATTAALAAAALLATTTWGCGGFTTTARGCGFTAAAARPAAALATTARTAAAMVATEVSLGLTFHADEHGSHGHQTQRQSNDISLHHKSSKLEQKIERSNLMSEMRDRRTKAKPPS